MSWRRSAARAAPLQALARADLTIDDIDVVELNEALGAQAVAYIRELGIPMEKVNIDRGGIGIDPGQPLALRLRPGMSVDAKVETR